MEGSGTKTNVGIIILAAGGSTRLGKPKQLLNYHGKKLLQHSIEVAIAANTGLVVVVLGHNANAIQQKIDSGTAHIVINDFYQQGMSSSIHCGLTEILKLAPEINSVIIMLCDQPLVSTSLVNNLINAHAGLGKPVVACAYADTFGPPVLFNKKLFPELMQLEGDTGARKVILNHADQVATIPFEGGELDIDSPADVLNLENRNNQ